MRAVPSRVAILLAGAALAWAPSGVQAQSRTPDGSLVFVGTYTGGKTNSQGIYAFRMHDGAGGPSFTPLGLAAETPSPSFIVVDARRGVLFAVNEVDSYEGQPTGSISAFTIDRATGKLTLINRRPSLGRAPCHLALDKDGRNLIVANYSSGTVAVLPVAANGELGEPKMVQHTGSSANRQRQQAPHAHCTNFDPAFNFLFACDLGIDKVMTYRLDPAASALRPHTPPFTAVRAGNGPRHMDFRRDGRFAYVLNELTSTVTAFAYDARKGVLREMQTVSTLPPGYTSGNSGAEIAVHPSGRFLYTSNRGHDSIARFRINAGTGQLTFLDAQPTGGRTPRHFAIDPSGRLLLAASQNSGSFTAFTINQSTGALTRTGPPVEVPAPVCVAFLR